ncbi:unnamed protein product [Urochloa decumbens]|uniref:GDSL esterase/lipase n=1 Tax=Urochloa decumbens TaxID=240449 RepID=A0ABC9GFD1_9POAL
MSNRAVISLLALATFLFSIATLSLATEAVELTRHLVPSIYVFGDSIVDVGNNNFLPPPAPRAKSPYGIDSPASITGRFTNGYNIADLVARRLGFMKSPPAYLSLTPETSHDLLRCRVGASYASGGSGILSTTALYKMGARRLGILDVPAIGCTPGARVPMMNGVCNDAANSMAQIFNKLLRVEVARAVKTSMPGMKYSIGSTYNVLIDLINKPFVAGLREVERACCGSGTLNAEAMCSMPNTTYCMDRDEYMFWDKLHPTQAMYERGVMAIFYGSKKYADPINFAGLIPSMNDTMTPPDVYSI